MRIRREKYGDLDVELVADLRDVQLPVGAFDVVYCSFLLEHVSGAREVLDRFRTAVRLVAGSWSEFQMGIPCTDCWSSTRRTDSTSYTNA